MAAYEISGIKWGAGVAGSSGGQVTWSFATTAGAMFGFDAAISNPIYQALIRAAFDAWEAVLDIDFVEVADSAASNIRLGWDGIDGSYGMVGQASYTYYDHATGFDTFAAAEIRFDSGEAWSTDPNAAGYMNFYAVALHEIGHVLGIDHSDDPNSIMYFQTGGAIDLTQLDIAAGQAIYGDEGPAGGGTAGNDQLVGTGSDDHLYGYAGDDNITGRAGNDLMAGGEGNDAMWAGEDDRGNDRLYGESGGDVLGGGSGDDTLIGGVGGDTLFGGAGDDWVDAGAGGSRTTDGAGIRNVGWAGAGSDRVDGDTTTDLLGGGAGNDIVSGYGGNDTLFGGDGNDQLSGGDGDDRLYGGNDDDVLSGGAGNDVLWGGAGNDLITGGAGQDLFGFGPSAGIDRITDFELGKDRLDLSAVAADFDSASDVSAAARNTSQGLQIDLGDGASVILAGLTTTDIANIDFVF
jgi:Ca2+-binding RTX toxin-like protein